MIRLSLSFWKIFCEISKKYIKYKKTNVSRSDHFSYLSLSHFVGVCFWTERPWNPVSTGPGQPIHRLVASGKTILLNARKTGDEEYILMYTQLVVVVGGRAVV